MNHKIVHILNAGDFFFLLTVVPTETGIILTLKTELERGDYLVAMSVADNQGESQVNIITAKVCDCTGEDKNCQDRQVAGLPIILGILGAILLLLCEFEIL